MLTESTTRDTYASGGMRFSSTKAMSNLDISGNTTWSNNDGTVDDMMNNGAVNINHFQ